MEKERKDTEFVKWIKLFGILLVIFNHSIFKWNVFKVFSNDIQNPLMSFASGFVFSLCIIDLKKYPTMKNLIYKKSKRLLLPLILVAFLYYYPLLWLLNFNSFRKNTMANIIKGFFEMTNVTYLWFLFAIFVIYIFLYKFIKITNKEKYKNKIILFIWTFAIFIVCNIVSYFLPEPDKYCTKRILLYLIFFYLGHFINIYYYKIKQILENKKYIVLTITFLISCIIYLLDYKFGFIAGNRNLGKDNLLLFITFIILELVKQVSMILFISSVIYFINKKIKDCKIINFLEKNSFNIYLYHLPIEYAVIIITKSRGTNTFISVIASIIAIVFSILIGKIIKKSKEELFKCKNKLITLKN